MKKIIAKYYTHRVIKRLNVAMTRSSQNSGVNLVVVEEDNKYHVIKIKRNSIISLTLVELRLKLSGIRAFIDELKQLKLLMSYKTMSAKAAILHLLLKETFPPKHIYDFFPNLKQYMEEEYNK